MRKIFKISCLIASFFLIGMSGLSAEMIEQKRSQIEVYGNVQFLLRIDESEKLGINFYSSETDVCALDSNKGRETLAEVLRKNRRYEDGTRISPRFRMDVDYFSSLDNNDHCLVSYELYLTQNLSKETALTEIVEKYYDYENSSPLLKINGMLHVDQDKLSTAFQDELKEIAQELLDALSHLQAEISRQSYR